MRIRQAFNINSLFKQLGLDNSTEAIADFISKNKIAANVKLHQAELWNDSQRSFLKDAIDDDEMWSILKDELNVRMHE